MTGVGPNRCDEAIQLRMSARACSSPARTAWEAACSQASAAAAACASFQCSQASSRQAPHRPAIVAAALEDRDDVPHRERGVLAAPVGDLEQLQVLLLNERARAGALVAHAGRDLHRRVQDLIGVRQPARLDQRGRELGQQLRARRVVGRERRRALQQADRRGQVAARECPAAGRPELS